jgi:hypothetical protein
MGCLAPHGVEGGEGRGHIKSAGAVGSKDGTKMHRGLKPHATGLFMFIELLLLLLSRADRKRSRTAIGRCDALSLLATGGG